MGQPGAQGSPPAAGGAPGAAGAGGPGNAPQGGPGAQGQAQPQPQAYQSPPDLSSMYVKLVQESRAADSFDRGLALMAGGFKGPPGGAQTIMNSVGPPLDAGATMNNIMQLNQYHQQQLGALDRRQDVRHHAQRGAGDAGRDDPHGHADRASSRRSCGNTTPGPTSLLESTRTTSTRPPASRSGSTARGSCSSSKTRWAWRWLGPWAAPASLRR